MGTQNICIARTLSFLFAAVILSVVHNNPVCADKESYEKAVEEFNSIKASDNIAPDIDDYISITVDDKSKNITPLERVKLRQYLKEMQNPMITREDLIALLKSKYDAIGSFEAEYVFNRTVNNSPFGHQNETVIYHYAKKGSQVLVESDQRDGENLNHILMSCAKDCFIVLNIPNEDNEHALVNASLSGPTEDCSIGYQHESPLSQSGLCDTSFYQSPHVYDDLVLFLNKVDSTIIFEKTKKVGDSNCLVIANLDYRFMLDIDKDFSLVQVVDCSGKHRSQRTISDLTPYGNSLWFPKKSVTEYFTDDDEKPYMIDMIDYKKIEVNHLLPDSFFSDVIPDGALVADGIRNMSYIWGNHSSIGSLIKETVKTKRQTIFRNFSVVLGLCLIACWGIIEWRKRRLLKGEVE